MKFGYPINLNNEQNKLIKHYQVKEKKMIIYYLDGTKEIVEYSKEKENAILERMLNEAKERDAYYEIHQLEKPDFGLEISSVLNTFLGLYLWNPAQNNWKTILGGTALMTGLIHFTIWFYQINKYLNKKEELIKYQLFFKIAEILNQLEKEGLCAEQFINININKIDPLKYKNVLQEYDTIFELYKVTQSYHLGSFVTNGVCSALLLNYFVDNEGVKCLLLNNTGKFLTIKIADLLNDWSPIMEQESILERKKFN